MARLRNDVLEVFIQCSKDRLACNCNKFCILSNEPVKLAYIIRLSTDKLDGVGRKVRDQIMAWRRLGVDARIIVLVNQAGIALDDVPGWRFPMTSRWGGVLDRIQRLVSYLRIPFSLQLWSPDIIYTRNGDRFFGYKWWAVCGAKRIVELNTNIETEVESLLRFGVIDAKEADRRVKQWIKGLNNADGMIAVSHEIERENIAYLGEKPSVVVCNSTNFDKIERVVDRCNQGNIRPKLVFICANLYEWHGFDKLIELAKAAQDDLDFVVIGEGLEGEAPKNVKVMPFMPAEKLSVVLASCDVGIASLAMHRAGLNEGSPLKVREYASMGMPIIAAYKETPFYEIETPEWFLELPNCESSPMSHIDDIVAFAQCWKGQSFNPNDARKYFNCDEVEKHRVQFFESLK
jgi:glycosyltransferase involved in cell wall biosynthesis